MSNATPSFWLGGADNSADNIDFELSVNETIEEGQIVAIFSGGANGLLRKANVNVNRVIGISKYDVQLGKIANIVQKGQANVLMETIPLQSDNGKPIYLSEANPGKGSLSPATSSETLRIFIGYLIGADGVTDKPLVMLDIDVLVQNG